MNERNLPMMPIWPHDFLAATAHWSCAERGAYAVLLMYEWILDGLPVNPGELAQLCNLPAEEFVHAWFRIGPKFHAEDGVLRNDKLEAVRENAIKKRDAHVKGANVVNAQRRAKRNAKRATDETLSDALSTTPLSLSLSLSSEEKKPPTPLALSATLSERSAILREPGDEVPNDAWRDVEGLNGDAFDAYLSHLSVLVANGQVRSQLAPHSRIAQAKWLAGQGPWSRQQDIVTRAIRNGWKTLERAETRSGRRSFDDLHRE